MPELTQRGVVKWFDPKKGFGFIEPSYGGKDIFVHQKGVRDKGKVTLETGDFVSFELQSAEKGPSAVNVIVLRKHSRE